MSFFDRRFWLMVLWTAAKYNLGIKFVVVNSLGRSNFSMHLVPMMNQLPRVLIDNPPINMEELARSMGVPAISVDTIAALETNLQIMFEKPGPCVLDVRVDDSLMS